MAKNKKKQKKNADFQKLKLKVGKRIKPAHVTDLSKFKTQKLKIVSSIHPTDDAPISDALKFEFTQIKKQISLIQHPNFNQASQAVQKLRQYLDQSEDISGDIKQSILDACMAALSSCGKSQHASNNEEFRLNLQRLSIAILQTMDENHLRSRFELLMTWMCLLVSHRSYSIVQVSVAILLIILEMPKFASICRSSYELNAVIIKFCKATKISEAQNRVVTHYLSAIKILHAYSKVMLCNESSSQNATTTDNGVVYNIKLEPFTVLPKKQNPFRHQPLNGQLMPRCLDFTFATGRCESNMMMLNACHNQNMSTLRSSVETFDLVIQVAIPVLQTAFDAIFDALNGVNKKVKGLLSSELINCVKTLSLFLEEGVKCTLRSAQSSKSALKSTLRELTAEKPFDKKRKSLLAYFLPMESKKHVIYSLIDANFIQRLNSNLYHLEAMVKSCL